MPGRYNRNLAFHSENQRNLFHFNESVKIKIKFKIDLQKKENSEIGLQVINQREILIFSESVKIKLFKTNKIGIGCAECIIPCDLLIPGKYRVKLSIHIPNKEFLVIKENLIAFELVETGSVFHEYQGADIGLVFVKCLWNDLS